MDTPFLNLLRDPWIPALHRDGQRRKIRPCDLTLSINDNPLIDVDWPRADFRAAQLEFLIGLLVVACQPASNSAWRRWWDKPPAPEELAVCFTPFETSFELDGPGPRFLQDRGELGDEDMPVAGLLIEQPGANTEKNNTDLFVKRGHVAVLGRSTAAIALYTLQTFAPAGGAGNRTSLRGGGPLTTLAVPASKPTLWHLLWLNVTRVFDNSEDGQPQEHLALVFPWLAPTRVSDKTGVTTTLADIHPSQCFWGMPRRIALAFEQNTKGAACKISGEVEDVIVRAYRSKPWGVNYQAVPHPLTPTYRTKATSTEWLFVHPQPGGIAYRHWISFVQPDAVSAPTRKPAACVTEAERRLAVVAENEANRSRLRMLGFDMDNMKARGFVETDMPLLFASDAGSGAEAGPRQQAFETLLRFLVGGATETASLVVGAIKAAEGADAGAELDLIRETFFKDTATAFFRTAEAGLARIEASPVGAEQILEITNYWRETTLYTEAVTVFDREIPVDALIDAANLESVKALVDARKRLVDALRGYGPKGKRLFAALGMSAPQAEAKKEVSA